MTFTWLLPWKQWESSLLVHPQQSWGWIFSISAHSFRIRKIEGSIPTQGALKSPKSSFVPIAADFSKVKETARFEKLVI